MSGSTSPFDLSGRVAVVTGGSRGLGASAAAAPRPREPPVTTATRPERSNGEVEPLIRVDPGVRAAILCQRLFLAGSPRGGTVSAPYTGPAVPDRRHSVRPSRRSYPHAEQRMLRALLRDNCRQHRLLPLH